jgi:hypothetical protein
VDIIREKIDKATVIQLMAASGTMGRSLGEKKIEPILEAYPDILISSDSVQTKIAKVKSLKGVETKTATLFVENIPAFIGFLESIGQTKKLKNLRSQKDVVNPQFLGESLKETRMKMTVSPIPSPSKNDVDVKHPLYGKHIVMTKVRDQTITEALKKYGATLSNAVRSNTFVLIIKSLGENSNKKTDAEKYGVPIMTPEMFIAKYL